MVLLRLQHLFRSKEVFLCSCPAQPHWHTGSAPCSTSQASCSTGTQLATPNGLWEHKAGKSLLLHSAESSTHSRILSYRTHPSLLRLKAFPGVIHWEINSEHSLLGQLYFAFPIAGLNDILLIPNCVCWGVFIYFCFSIRDPLTETQTLA